MTPQPSDLLTTAEAAEEMRVQRSTVWRKCRNRELPHIRLSARDYRIRRADLEAWLHAQSRGPSLGAFVTGPASLAATLNAR